MKHFHSDVRREPFELPHAVYRRLEDLLDEQDAGSALIDDERQEAEGFVDDFDPV